MTIGGRKNYPPYIYIAITNAIIEDMIPSLTSETIKKLKDEVKWFLFFAVAISLT